MIFTLIRIGVILLILYLLARELKDSWTTHREMRRSQKKWDEWERIPGYWDVYIAERGGGKGWVRKLESLEVKTPIEGETDEIVTPTMPKISSTHSIVPAH